MRTFFKTIAKLFAFGFLVLFALGVFMSTTCTGAWLSNTDLNCDDPNWREKDAEHRQKMEEYRQYREETK